MFFKTAGIKTVDLKP